MSETTAPIHEITLQGFNTSEFPVQVWLFAADPTVPPIHQQLWQNGTHYVPDSYGQQYRRVGSRIAYHGLGVGLFMPISETWSVGPNFTPPVIPPTARIIRVVVRNFIDPDTDNQ
jgi:hypothetical protein